MLRCQNQRLHCEQASRPVAEAASGTTRIELYQNQIANFNVLLGRMQGQRYSDQVTMPLLTVESPTGPAPRTLACDKQAETTSSAVQKQSASSCAVSDALSSTSDGWPAYYCQSLNELAVTALSARHMQAVQAWAHLTTNTTPYAMLYADVGTVYNVLRKLPCFHAVCKLSVNNKSSKLCAHSRLSPYY